MYRNLHFGYFLILFGLCVFNSIPRFLAAQEVKENHINPALLSAHWPAFWIAHADASGLEYGVFHFRRSFDLPEKPGEFIVHISADNRYRFFVNGQPVCFGPARGDLAHWFYETVDIAPWLQSGRNTLAVVVWNFGGQKPWAQFSLRTAFILQGNTPAEALVNTGTSWKVTHNLAYSPASAGKVETQGQFVVVGPCDRVDGSLYPWGWENADFDDKEWKNASRLDNGHPRGIGTDINWVLTPRRIPMMETGMSRFKAVRRCTGPFPPEGFIPGKEKWRIPAGQKITVLLDQGTLTTGYPELTVSGGKSATIRMTYAESLFDKQGQKGNRNETEGKEIRGYSDYFLPDGGHSRLFRPLWFRTWRYLQMDIETKDDPLILENFSSEFTAYPLEEKAVFKTGHALHDSIWKVGWRTARLCANETYYDCPYYEQLQYVGDTRIQALISLYVSGDDRLMRNALMQFNESRIYEGLTYSRYPTDNPQFIPPFSLFWVAMVHDYWMHRDDPAFVKQFLPGIRGVLDWFAARIDPATGLLGKVEYWNFTDWATAWPWNNEARIGGVPKGGMEGHSSIHSLQLAYAAERAAALFSAFGHKREALEYRNMAANITGKVYQQCWDEARGYLADTPAKEEFSMHAQILAVLTGAIPSGKVKDFTLRFMNDENLIQPTMYFRFYLTQALHKAGLADKYLETLGLWEDMLHKGLTTFAENPDPARSDCHAWSSSPNYDFLATVAGIRPASPGFRTVQMQPALGKLRFIEGRMPHPAGMITFQLNRINDIVLEGSVTLPVGVSGTFRWKNREIRLSGDTRIILK